MPIKTSGRPRTRAAGERGCHAQSWKRAETRDALLIVGRGRIAAAARRLTFRNDFVASRFEALKSAEMCVRARVRARTRLSGVRRRACRIFAEKKKQNEIEHNALMREEKRLQPRANSRSYTISIHFLVLLAITNYYCITTIDNI